MQTSAIAEMKGFGRKEISKEQSIVFQSLLLQVTATTYEPFNTEKRAESHHWR